MQISQVLDKLNPQQRSNPLLKNIGYSRQPLPHRLHYREVCGISRKSAPIHVIVHAPKTEAGQQELAKRVAGVHADLVRRYIQKLRCPSEEKAALLDAVIATVKKNAGD